MREKGTNEYFLSTGLLFLIVDSSYIQDVLINDAYFSFNDAVSLVG